MSDDKTNFHGITNRQLLIPYLVPYLAYVSINSLFGDRISHEFNYTLKLFLVPPLLVWAWRWYFKITGPGKIQISIITGLVTGITGCILWILLLNPFITQETTEEWSNLGFFLRVISASFIVPVFEEFFIRGYIFRFSFQISETIKKKIKHPFLYTLDNSNINDLNYSDWNIWAIIISTIIFSIGHHTSEWPACIAYGLLMSGLLIIRKDLLSCIVAHGTTNMMLALYVKHTGQWGLW